MQLILKIYPRQLRSLTQSIKLPLADLPLVQVEGQADALHDAEAAVDALARQDVAKLSLCITTASSIEMYLQALAECLLLLVEREYLWLGRLRSATCEQAGQVL